MQKPSWNANNELLFVSWEEWRSNLRCLLFCLSSMTFSSSLSRSEWCRKWSCCAQRIRYALAVGAEWGRVEMHRVLETRTAAAHCELYCPRGTGMAHSLGLGSDVQALLQMADIPSAINVMQYYTTVQPSVR